METTVQSTIHTIYLKVYRVSTVARTNGDMMIFNSLQAVFPFMIGFHVSMQRRDDFLLYLVLFLAARFAHEHWLVIPISR